MRTSLQRRRRAGGWSFVELLGVVVLMAISMPIVASLTNLMTRDCSSSRRAAEANTALSAALSRLARDVRAAESLPARIGSAEAGPDRLLVRTEDGPVAYDRGEGSLSRVRLDSAGRPAESTRLEWATRDAAFTWRRREEAGRTVAVEVSHWIPGQWQGRPQKLLANSHVFFVGIDSSKGGPQ